MNYADTKQCEDYADVCRHGRERDCTAKKCDNPQTFVIYHFVEGYFARRYITQHLETFQGSFARFTELRTGKIIILSGDIRIEEQ